MGDKGKVIRDLVDAGTKWVFGVINLMMWAAPIGVFGAMAFTVGRYGLASLGPLVKLIVVFYLTNVLFLVVIFGAIAWAAGSASRKFLAYIKEEILIVFGTIFVELRPARPDGEDGVPRLLEIGRRVRGADQLHLQHGRLQHLHDHGGPVRRPGHQHRARPGCRWGRSSRSRS